ncbi:MAG TPA: carboxylesterase/lipase family protein [Rhizomicrobium sp.]|nr:carboxylesterase/lipase family protein [Rhizomicrobium sp.]
MDFGALPKLGRRDLLKAGASAGALTLISSAVRAALPGPGVAMTATGPVIGAEENGVHVFKGIRYGLVPAGPLRFKPPVRSRPWRRPVPAFSFGSPAVQMPLGTAAQEPKTQLAKALQPVYPTLAEWKLGKEDCLYLNVWTPGIRDGGKRPIMVWLHGGGFAYGSGAWPMYDGGNLARKGNVVVVTLNHRLNVFGYLELGDIFGGEYAQSGNLGMLDIVLALEWIRDSAEAFGGDPKNVTIFGESGGGMKVSTLMAMPAAKGLFHKAIIESGPGLKGVPKNVATQDAKEILAALKITKPEGLQSAPAEQIVKAAYTISAKRGPGAEIRFLAPVVDGDVLPANPFDPAAPSISANVPLIVGTNKDEMTLFMAGEPWFGKLTDQQLAIQAKAAAGPKAEELLAALRKTYPDYSPSYLMTQVIASTFMLGDSIKLAERKAAQHAAPVYMYQLTWETPVGDGILKSPHTLEIPFVFDNVERTRPLVGPGADPQKLADQMSAAWIAFAKTGNPNNAAIPDWPAYSSERRTTMMFDVKSRTADDPDSAVRQVLQA